MPAETQEARKQRSACIVRLLSRAYPDAKCALEHQSPFELLVATILSAQCTDAMVNRVTAELFAKYPTPGALAAAELADVERLVKRTGFYRQKAKSIQSTARDLVEKFGGEVPRTLEQLVTLRGVARKTANVVLGNCFDTPGLTVDTHMQRVNRRLGLARSDDADAIERELMALLPETDWTAYSLRVIHHGRVCCDARRPRCGACPLAGECRRIGVDAEPARRRA